MRWVWLALTILGTIAGLITLFSGAQSDSGGFDLGHAIAMITITVWCLTETMMRRNWEALLTLPAMLLGVGCALPLYLFIRSGPIA